VSTNVEGLLRHLSKICHDWLIRQVSGRLQGRSQRRPRNMHAGLLSEPTQTRAGRRLEHDEFRSSSDQTCSRKGLHGTFGQRSELFLQCLVLLEGAPTWFWTNRQCRPTQAPAVSSEIGVLTVLTQLARFVDGLLSHSVLTNSSDDPLVLQKRRLSGVPEVNPQMSRLRFPRDWKRSTRCSHPVGPGLCCGKAEIAAQRCQRMS